MDNWSWTNIMWSPMRMASVRGDRPQMKSLTCKEDDHRASLSSEWDADDIDKRSTETLDLAHVGGVNQQTPSEMPRRLGSGIDWRGGRAAHTASHGADASDQYAATGDCTT